MLEGHVQFRVCRQQRVEVLGCDSKQLRVLEHLRFRGGDFREERAYLAKNVSGAELADRLTVYDDHHRSRFQQIHVSYDRLCLDQLFTRLRRHGTAQVSDILQARC